MRCCLLELMSYVAKAWLRYGRGLGVGVATYHDHHALTLSEGPAAAEEADHHDH